MARRVINITDEWQIVSVRSALFEIYREPQGEGNKILFNDTDNETGAEIIPRGNKGLQLLQPIQQSTYVKSALPITEVTKQYQIVVED